MHAHLRSFTGSAQSRHERQKAETKERLYRAALSLFAERGLAATTVEDITQAAGVAKGTFFNYFRTKEQVFSVLIETQLGNVLAAAAEAPQAGPSTKAILHRLFLRNAEEFGRGAILTRALFSSIFLNEAAREITAHGMSEGRRGLAKIIALGQQRGEMRADRKPDSIAFAFQQALFGTAVVWAIQGGGKLATRLDASFENFWAGVAAEAGK
jgi:AcrR family transcriptional regulator